MPDFARVPTTHQTGLHHVRSAHTTVIFNLHDKLLDSRHEIEESTLQSIRRRMINSGDLSSHLVFLRTRKADLCFYGCKLIDALREEFPFLNQSQVNNLANFLFEKRFLVPVMKYVQSFKCNTVLYRLSIDEQTIQQNLLPERVRTQDLVTEILKKFEIIPSTFSGQRLWEIVSEIGKREIVRFGGLMTEVQLQFLLLHGFICPEKEGDEEQCQLFSTDYKYAICNDLSGEGPTDQGQMFSHIESAAPTLEGWRTRELKSPPKSRKCSIVTTSIVSKSLKLAEVDSETPSSSNGNRKLSKNPSLNNMPRREGNSPNSTLTDNSLQRSRPTSEKKRSKNLQELKYAVVDVDEDGNAMIVDPEDLKPTLKPLEYDYKPLPGNYEIFNMIDVGKFGNVYLCQDKPSQALMAVKQVHYNPNSEKSKKLFASLMNEVEILKFARHPHIVRYYGFNSGRGTFNIFMEYVEGGSMRRYIEVKGPLSNDETIESLAHILLGLSYLHRNFIIHRDLKGANVLRSADGILKLADFGYSKKFEEENEENKMSSFVGTLCWMCPEIIKGKGYDNKCDVWALAATCYEFLTGNPPYFDLEPYSVMKKIVTTPMRENLKFGKEISDELKKLMLRCFEMDSSLRPSVDEILTLPMFSSHVSSRRCIFYT
jgi:hypothetical protein